MFFILIVIICIFSTNILDKLDLKYYQMFILNIYIFTILLSIKKKYIVIILFLVSLFVFMYGRIVLLPLIFEDKITISWFHYYDISEMTLYFIYKILIYNLFGIILGILYFKPKIYRYRNTLILKNKKIILLFLFFTLIFFCLNNYSYLKKLYAVGAYLDIYLGKNFSSQGIVRMLGIAFYPLLIISISLYNEDKCKNLLLFLYLFSNFIFSLSGSRAAFINSVFVVIYFSIKKIKIRNLIILVCCFLSLITFSQMLLLYRSHNKVQIKTEKIFKEFIFQQGITGTYLALLKDKPELFIRKLPYIFSTKKPKSQLDNSIDILGGNRIELAHQLSIRSNYSMYKKGMGMGGNYIIEMYDLGKEYGVLILSFFHTYIALYFFQNINRYRYLFRIFIFLCLDQYFLMPRASYLPEIFRPRTYCTVIIYFIIILIIKMSIKRRKIEKNINSYK